MRRARALDALAAVLPSPPSDDAARELIARASLNCVRGVWAVRLAATNALTTAVKKGAAVRDHADAVRTASRLAYEDPKYAKVRAAGLRLLAALYSCDQITWLGDTFAEEALCAARVLCTLPFAISSKRAP